MKKFLMIISMLLVLSFAFFLVCDILTDFTSQKDAKGGNQESSVKDQDSMDNSFSSGNENISGSEKQILRLSEGELDWIMIPVRGSDGNIGYGLGWKASGLKPDTYYSILVKTPGTTYYSNMSAVQGSLTDGTSTFRCLVSTSYEEEMSSFDEIYYIGFLEEIEYFFNVSSETSVFVFMPFFLQGHSQESLDFLLDKLYGDCEVVVSEC